MTEKGLLINELNELRNEGFIPPVGAEGLSNEKLRSLIGFGKERLYRKRERLHAQHIKNVLVSSLNCISKTVIDERQSRNIEIVASVLDAMEVEYVDRDVVDINMNRLTL